MTFKERAPGKVYVDFGFTLGRLDVTVGIEFDIPLTKPNRKWWFNYVVTLERFPLSMDIVIAVKLIGFMFGVDATWQRTDTYERRREQALDETERWLQERERRGP